MSDNRDTHAGKKLDMRIRRTRSAIRDAFVALMQRKEYAAITITDISELAGINRKTFYAHYETKEQVLFQLLEEMFSDLIGTLMYSKGDNAHAAAHDLYTDLIVFFEKVDAYREEIDTLVTSQTSGVAFAITDDVIQRSLEGMRMHENSEKPVWREIYVSRIKNFFLTCIDWRMEQADYTPAQAAGMYEIMMRMSLSDIFAYKHI